MSCLKPTRAIKKFVDYWQKQPCVEEEHSRSFWIEFVEQEESRLQRLMKALRG